MDHHIKVPAGNPSWHWCVLAAAWTGPCEDWAGWSWLWLQHGLRPACVGPHPRCAGLLEVLPGVACRCTGSQHPIIAIGFLCPAQANYIRRLY